MGDAGDKNETAGDSGRLAAFLRGRFDDDRRTIVTCNLQRGLFDSRYGNRLSQRVNECGRYLVCRVVEVRS